MRHYGMRLYIGIRRKTFAQALVLDFLKAPRIFKRIFWDDVEYVGTSLDNYCFDVYVELSN